MDILIDGRNDLVWAESGSTLGSILDQLKTFLAQNGRAILECALDGEFLDDKRRDALRGDDVSRFRTLEVKTISPVELSAMMLRALTPLMPRLADGLVETARRLQQGKSSQGFRLLEECLAGMQEGLRTIEVSAGLAGIAIDGLKAGDRPVGTRLRELKDLLGRTRASIDAGDPVGLADLVEHELAPAVRAWEEVAAALRACLEAPA
jgi:hypothetical protein